jgi:hypothetical protein
VENSQVSFSGFRLLAVKGDVIDEIHFIPTARLEAHGYRMPLGEAILPGASGPPARRWLSVSEGSTTPGGYITAVATGDDRIAIFLADPNGGIFAAQARPPVAWGPWRSVSEGSSMPGAPLAAITRGEHHPRRPCERGLVRGQDSPGAGRLGRRRLREPGQLRARLGAVDRRLRGQQHAGRAGRGRCGGKPDNLRPARPRPWHLRPRGITRSGITSDGVTISFTRSRAGRFIPACRSSASLVNFVPGPQQHVASGDLLVEGMKDDMTDCAWHCGTADAGRHEIIQAIANADSSLRSHKAHCILGQIGT